VLDYGCGYGDLTYAVSKTHKVVGVDLDPARIAFATGQYPSIPFAVCGAETLSFPDGSFDIVLSTVVIHFTSDPIAHLQEAHRLLRPHGHLVITCQNSPVVWDAIRHLLGKPPVSSKLWVTTRSAFHEILQEQGFEILKESHFYDPPTDGSWTLSGFGLTLIQQFLSVLRVRSTCSYYTIVAARLEGSCVHDARIGSVRANRTSI
jgi:ubiquinone/menaquinone biosynthesis C-methylase UbiE